MKAALLFLFCTLAANAAPLSEIISKDSSIMILIPAGSFQMGSTNQPDESPERKVNVPSFYIDTYEVTGEQYDNFLQATGHRPPLDWADGKLPPKLRKHPVVNVTWNDATAYAKWAGKRLPTEAEWEKACRGSDGLVYPWGNAGEGKKAASGADARDKTHPEGRTFPVGSFPDDVSPYGVMDMAGNAWEWTADWYKPYPGNDQFEVEFGSKYKVIRGGGGIDYFQATSTRRCADRAHALPHSTHDALGFRCAQDVK
ncbi:MAG TPA: formylglycine-generating enzyme family protein [Verrucomicrobiae bacterium]|nr:formylglycine-generating enzyme family protein [Verrucomicrobiae bacterium]